jgi:hypothetical protein
MRRYGFTDAQYEDKMQTQPNLLLLLGTGMSSDVQDGQKFTNDASVEFGRDGTYIDLKMM